MDLSGNRGAMNEKEMLENILTAEVLTLAKTLEIHDSIIKGTRGTYLMDAIREIKDKREAVIQQLLSTR